MCKQVAMVCAMHVAAWLRTFLLSYACIIAAPQSPQTGSVETVRGAEGDLLLVSAVDGRLYAMDRKDGTLRWSADTGGKLVGAFQNETVFAGSVIVPSLSGELLVFRSSAAQAPGALDQQVQVSSGLHKLPVGAPELVGLAPMVGDDGMLYLGEKTSDSFLVDPFTGAMDRVRSSGGGGGGGGGSAAREGAAHEQVRGQGAKIVVGRRDYRVTAVDSGTGALAWNATVGFVSVASRQAFVCVCVRVSLCVWIYVHTYIHTYMHACIHTYIHIYIYIIFVYTHLNITIHI